jgi:peroxiredoxin Q/BCP
MTHLKIGDKAPEINTETFDNKPFTINLLNGKKLVLYFYPKGNTPGCTVQACNLNDNLDALKSRGYEVVGISPDSATSHQKFIEKFGLKFSLLLDTDKKIANDYGVWGEKKNYGKTYFGIHRTTFIIDQNGVIEDIIEKVDTKNHATQILKLQ